VLEVKDRRYTTPVGGTRVTSSSVVDIDPSNALATLVADLCEPRSLPADAFDCFILTQTLHLLVDPATAMRNCWNSLAPGGVILLTVPSLSRLSRSNVDYWRWTPAGLRAFIESTLPAASVEIEGHGNLLAAVAFLFGLAVEEFRPGELDTRDDGYPIVTTARIGKPAGAEALTLVR
jgi:SAM-dependent methyltransferase